MAEPPSHRNLPKGSPDAPHSAGNGAATPARKKKVRERRPPRDLPHVGWREWVALPELGIAQIKVKVDTGARTSALHAFGIRRLTKNGEAWVRFEVHPDQRSSESSITVEARVVDERSVRPSTGKVSVRPVIVTRLRLGENEWPIEVTLVRRDMMGFRMLLGRQAIRHRCLVDPGRSFLSGKPSEQGPRQRREKPSPTSTPQEGS